MSLLASSQPSRIFSKIPKQLPFPFLHTTSTSSSLSFSLSSSNPTNFRFPSLRLRSSLSDDTPTGPDDPPRISAKISDEWGEEAEQEPESSYTKLSDADPPKEEDEWGGGGGVVDDGLSGGNGSAATVKDEAVDDKLLELKRCLVDSVYGTELGFRAGPEVRAEVLELVNQLEIVNPTPAPVETTELLNGNWILLYTAFSELLPLLAAGALPLLKVEKITQEIDTNSLSIVNTATLSNPFATFSFSASATFEARTPSRIQVKFKESILQPPEIKSRLDLPENVDLFGLKVNLSPVQQTLNPLQEAVASIARTISGQPPLKVPTPGGDLTQSWLLTTYLDKDLRISRGDGGLFVLAREGCPLLDQ